MSLSPMTLLPRGLFLSRHYLCGVLANQYTLLFFADACIDAAADYFLRLMPPPRRLPLFFCRRHFDAATISLLRRWILEAY